MLGRTDSRLRLVLLLAFVVVLSSILALRLAYWQLGQGDHLRRLAQAQLVQPSATEIVRGDITDRRGNVLATTAYRDLLAAHPDLMTEQQRDETAAGLARILGLADPEARALRESFAPDRAYVVVARRLTESQSEQVRAGVADGDLHRLILDAHAVRFYPSAGGSPDSTLASQLLGFVTEDGQGRYGVEQAGHDLLAGQSGATALNSDTAPLPRAGGSVQLTIDASLQLRLERELYAAWVADRATRVSGVIMDPDSGAILAWASVPGYDANDYAATAEKDPQLFADPIASQVYEPGSVMKMFTAAAALERGVVGPQSLVEDGKFLRLGTNQVGNFDRRSMGSMTFEDAIAHSRNVATGRVALSLGATVDDSSHALYDMWQRLGIGRPTGIELAGEAIGLVADPSTTRWQAIDLVNRAFGQAVAVTPLQLATSFSAMVNGGTMPRAHLYAALDGRVADVPVGERVMSPELSAQLRQMMVHVVEEGPQYADETLIPGYVVGGKTGTAQIWDNRRKAWLDNVYNHTFVGFVGGRQPEAVIVVRIHDTEPRVERRWGMTLEMTSNELFRRVALETIDVLDIAPQDTRLDPPVTAVDEE